jgi:hypothetical protein
LQLESKLGRGGYGTVFRLETLFDKCKIYVVVVSKKYLYAAKCLILHLVNINVGGLGTVDCLGIVPKL